MDTLLVGIIVGAACIYTGRTFYKKFKTGKDAAGAGGCGCTSCGMEKKECESVNPIQNSCSETKE